jgi:isoamylase
LQIVMDSLRYWVTSFHVDGFRFDLGVTLGREAGGGFDPGAGFFDALRQDPVLTRAKLISEPWDLGPGGYQLGQHPAGFSEWNDRFRDSARRFWRGDAGERPELAARLTASSDLFDRNGRGPWASINYVTSHDGFTLADVVSYAQRHNEANGEGNADGTRENYSANWGVEGPTEDPAILETRGRVQRAMLATLLFAHGTPMLLGGDEFGRSQGGNNNPYCQDNEISWWDWRVAASPRGDELRQFVARLIAIRRAHPVLRWRHFLHAQREPAPGVRDIDWFDSNGDDISDQAWKDPAQRVLCLRRAARDDEGGVSVLTLLMNPTADDQLFTLAAPALPGRILVDSAHPAAPEAVLNENKLLVGRHSVVLLHGTLEARDQ